MGERRRCRCCRRLFVAENRIETRSKTVSFSQAFRHAEQPNVIALWPSSSSAEPRDMWL